MTDHNDHFYSEEAFRQAAKDAKLRYVHDTEPGITRKKSKDTFHYHAPNGDRITKDGELERIKKLGIPPAYSDVWICPLPNGHLQATGRDARNRKQYRYHAKWGEVRGETKFQHMAEFGAILPNIRTQIEHDMAARTLSRERVLATVVSLMDKCFIRVGNEQYARENESYGLTTLHKDHVDVSGASLNFEFKGKSGKMWNVHLRDKRVAATIKKLEDIEGQDLFQYLDDHGNRHKISSHDVNNYLHDITQKSFTAKDFRTWAATSKAIELLASWPYSNVKKDINAHLKTSIKSIADELGHTPSICRKCYIHPQVINRFASGQLSDWHLKSKSKDAHARALLFLSEL